MTDEPRGKLSGVLGRVVLALASTLATIALLVAVEGVLRVFDLGPTARRDPLHGFSATARHFERAESADGEAVHRLAGAPGLAEATFRAQKPPGGFRAFVVGGSSAAGVPYGYDLAFAAWLEARLRAELPDTPVEVVNASASGFGTRRILNRVRELAAYEPDLLVVYAGHNEFAEARYFAEVVSMDPRVFALWDRLAATRLYGGLASILRREQSAEPAQIDLAAADAPQQMFQVSQVGDGAAGRAHARRSWAEAEALYRDNVSEMIRIMHSAGARVLLLTLTQNFADWPPGASRHGTELSPEQAEAWSRLVDEGDARSDASCEAAIASWERAAEIDDAYASLQFRIANCLRAFGRYEAARARYRLASDLDRVPLGAPTRYNEVLRELAQQHGTLFLDVDAALRTDDADGLIGDDHIIDVMHPRLETQLRIAQEIARTLDAAGLPVGALRNGAPLPEPDIEALFARRPSLRVDEHLVRALMCYLAKRSDCVREEAASILTIVPGHPVALRLARDVDVGGRAERSR